MTKKRAGGSPKGPDNNHRLAELEAGVSSLGAALSAAGIDIHEGGEPIGQAIALTENWKDKTLALASLLVALTENGIDVADAADPVGSAIKAINTQGEHINSLNATINVQAETIREGGEVSKGLHERINICNSRIAELEQGDLVEVYRSGVSGLAAAMVGAGIEVPNDADVLSLAAAHFAAAEEASGDATPGELAAIARAETAEKRVAELAAEVEDLNAKLAGGEFVRDADPVEPSAPRDAVECGEAYGNLSAADLNLRVEEGARFELVFSDGDNEILEFERVPINAVGGLVRHGNRYMIDPVILINGPRTEGAAPITIAGAALLADGEQVGFCPFDRPLVVNPGDQRQFGRAFLFG